MGSTPDGSVAVVVDNDIKLPLRTAVSVISRLVTKEKVEVGIFQLTSAEKYSPVKDKLALCETIVEVAEVVLIILANKPNKRIKIVKGEEVGKALPLRSIQRVKFDEEGRKNQIK